MQDIYANQIYLDRNPTWHEEDSPWKAAEVLRMVKKHKLAVRSVAEIGCGVGGVLDQLYQQLPKETEFFGFDISPAAIAQAKKKEQPRAHFFQEDLLRKDICFDLLLVLDVIEHVPAYLEFCEGCRTRARFKLFHIPLDIHVSSVLRASFLEARLSVGHIHYFTAESALATLTDTGHKIVDSFYTNGAIALAALHPSLKRTVANAPRRLISLISTAWAARVLGGYSLMVLTE